MSEKKIVVENRKLLYEGPFEIAQFFAAVEGWMEQKGYEKEVKMKRQYVEEKRKNFEWVVELFGHITEYASPVIRVRALFQDLSEVSVRAEKRIKKLDWARALIVFDGFLETTLAHRWSQRPWFIFSRAVFERYIYKFQERKFDDVVADDLESLYLALKDFFNRYAFEPVQKPKKH
ncbi:hypothetical protein HYU14_00990 [Candidatus Woesearchaeota archaeon]|nr:hypothetical protein [Candidatus Woesearchaeota archaeon]